MSIKEYIGGQCANPEGLGGLACAKFMNFFNAEHYRAVKKFVCKLDGARILDIGFGNGVTIKKLSKNINAKFYGVDISADMVEKAVISTEEKRKIKEISSALCEDYATYIHLAFFEELENEDIARIMKKSKKQMANLSYRARNALREALRREGICYEK